MTNENPIERGLRPVPHNAATTTNAGAPIASDDFSLQQGEQGYIGLHDVGLNSPTSTANAPQSASSTLKAPVHSVSLK